MMQVAGFLLIALCAVAQAKPQGDVGVHDVIPGIGEYYFNGIPSNWTTAYRQCQASGGHLAVINSDPEKEALQEMITRHGATSILVGFHDQFVEGVYTFITGWKVPDSLWAPGQPRGGSANSCGALDSTGAYDASCAALLPFICELSADQGGETNNDGFVLLEKFGYYKYHSQELKWPEAWEVCREENSNLLVLETVEERDALWAAYDFFLNVWVGVHRFWGPDDNYITINNTKLSELGYQEWWVNTPTSYLVNPYVAVYSSGGLIDQAIQTKRAFFCERPLA